MTVVLVLASLAMTIAAIVIAHASVMLRRAMGPLTVSAERLAVLPDQIDRLDRKVDTGNTKTLGGLAALAEGRRIEVDVEPGDRTVHEQGYVDNLHDDESGAPPGS